MGLVEKKSEDFAGTPPSYVDFEDLFAALDEIRKRNTYGYGYREPVEITEEKPEGEEGGSAPASEGDEGDETRPWLNEPFEDEDGRPVGAGEGFLLPFVLEGAEERHVLVGGHARSPRRTSAASATFNALAVALAPIGPDRHGIYHPATRAGRLDEDALATWTGESDDAPEEGAVSLLPGANLGVQIDPKKARRGDVVVIEWDPSGRHVYFCWDAHVHGDDVWLQLLSSQAQTHGVGVPLRRSSAARVGKFERIQRFESVLWTPVHRAEREEGWLTTPAARRFYREHAHWFRVPGKEGDSGGRVKSVHVGRFHRAFPRAPIGALGFDNNEHAPGGEARPGGFFPIGTGATWHGGIHLYPEKDDLVRAPLDAVLLAARLTTDDNAGDENQPATDAGFVLLKTKLKIGGFEDTLFILLYHFAKGLEKNTKLTVSWLDSILQIPAETDEGWNLGLDVTKDYAKVLPVPPAGAKDATVFTEDRTGADDESDGALLVFEKRDRSLEPKGKIATAAIVEVLTGVDAHGWAKVKTKDGSLEGFVFGETRLFDLDPQEYDTKLRDKRKQLLEGKVVDLSDLDRRIVVRAGEVVGQVGKVAGERAIHFELFSKDMIAVDGRTKPDIEETDPKLWLDRKKFEDRFFELLGQALKEDKSVPPLRHYMLGGTNKGDDQVHAEEIREFFAESPLRAKLRPLVTRHHSGWGDKVDWSSLKSDPKLKHVPAAAKDALLAELDRHRWWRGSFLAKEGLPSDQIVHHYHPIHFLAWLDAQREADTSGELHESVFENHEG